MPILTLHSAQSVLDSNLYRPMHFLTDKLLTGVWLHDALAPPTEIHKFWEHSSNLSVMCRIAPSASGCS